MKRFAGMLLAGKLFDYIAVETFLVLLTSVVVLPWPSIMETHKHRARVRVLNSRAITSNSPCLSLSSVALGRDAEWLIAILRVCNGVDMHLLAESMPSARV